MRWWCLVRLLMRFLFKNFLTRLLTAMYNLYMVVNAGRVHSKLGDHFFSSRLSGMRGLLNYGLSCCVNSLLQAFSATWELTDLLEKWDPPGNGGGSHDVPVQLKRALLAMQSDRPQPAPHHDFLHCLDRNCIRLHVQHDADEVFLSILNLVQQQMDGTALAPGVQSLYKISVEMHLECLECASIQSGTSYLLNLPLHISEGHNSLEDCMTSFFELQELRGSDNCLCARCGTRTPSKQGVKLLSLPHILCVHLKRFRSFRGFTKKLDCTVTFPESFDFLEILKEEVFSKDYVKNDCRYVLYAVIVHCGSAFFGHYMAYVRHRRNQSWYYADDSHVRQATWEDVQRTYGGNDRHTAYLLMYRRSTKEEEEQQQCSG